MTNKINIIFLGDVVGRPGRWAVDNFVRCNKNFFIKPELDFLIVNVENASHGFGLTEKNYNELVESGIDCMTSGNHIWDKKDIFAYIENADKLLRPLNYPDGTLGVGVRIFEKNFVKIAVMSLLGRVFMDVHISPWLIIQEEVEKLKKITPIIIIDFHAEATAEKVCFAKYCSELGVSAVLGTHTHVQTADEQIVGVGTAYITDAGFCGATDGIIGMGYDVSFRRMTTGMPERFDIAEGNRVQINGVVFSVDTVTGIASDIKRINEVFDKEDNNIMKG